MGELRVLGPEGDVMLLWEPGDDEAIRRAHGEWDLLIKAGFLLYEMDPFGNKGKRVKTWKEDRQRVIAVPGPAKPLKENHAKGHRNTKSPLRSRAMSGGPRHRRASW